MLGMVASKGMLPSQLLPINTDLNDIEPWTHYFGCAFSRPPMSPAARMKPGYPRSTPTPSPD